MALLKKLLDYLKANPVMGKLAVLLLVFAAGLGIGRYSLPAKVVTKTEIKEVKTTDTQKVADDTDHKIVTITETDKPDGTKIKETKIQDNSEDKTSSAAKTTDTTDKTTQKTVEYQKGWDFRFMAAGRFSSTDNGLRYGVGVDKRILGPFTVGAFGMTDGTVGLSLGVQF